TVAPLTLHDARPIYLGGHHQAVDDEWHGRADALPDASDEHLGVCGPTGSGSLAVLELSVGRRADERGHVWRCRTQLDDLGQVSPRSRSARGHRMDAAGPDVDAEKVRQRCNLLRWNLSIT